MTIRAAMLTLCLLASCAAPPSDVYLQVLGVAQDAGYPQSACYKEHCQRAWDDHELRRNVVSLAYVDGVANKKYLFDATPDLPEQLQMLETNAPDSEVGLDGVFLTHGHIGHYTGLMHFGREAQGSEAVAVFALPRMFEYLTQNGPWSQLVSLGNIQLFAMSPSRALQVNPNLQVTALLVPHRDEFTETAGFLIQGPQKTALFIPDIDKWDRWETDIRVLLQQVDYAFLDATFFAADELPARNMNEIPHPYVVESFELFADLPASERAKIYFIHFNHTNPLLIDGSKAQQEVEQRGFHVAKQGMLLPM
jgi:pyrroloquinoline quinone biosynthesis protein B